MAMSIGSLALFLVWELSLALEIQYLTKFIVWLGILEPRKILSIIV